MAITLFTSVRLNLVISADSVRGDVLMETEAVNVAEEEDGEFLLKLWSKTGC